MKEDKEEVRQSPHGAHGFPPVMKRGSFVRSTFSILGLPPYTRTVLAPILTTTTMMSFLFLFSKELPATKEKRSGICAALILRGVFLSCFFRLLLLSRYPAFPYCALIFACQRFAWAYLCSFQRVLHHKNVKSKASNLETFLS